jgi:voltage-gated potassium channel
VSSRRRAILLGSDSGRNAVHRIQVAVAALAAVTVFGTVGYVVLGFGWLEALYQTVTTVATVGFREVRPLSPVGMAFTLVLIVVGVGTVLYNLGVIVEALTEGHLREHLWRRRMDRTIAQMSEHVIICGFGRVGRAAAQHLVDGTHDVVVIDLDPARVEGATIPHLVGDAANEATLREAGIERAHALICALDTDADTVYATSAPGRCARTW